jgi:hypothetical protein
MPPAFARRFTAFNLWLASLGEQSALPSASMLLLLLPFALAGK